MAVLYSVTELAEVTGHQEHIRYGHFDRLSDLGSLQVSYSTATATEAAAGEASATAPGGHSATATPG